MILVQNKTRPAAEAADLLVRNSTPKFIQDLIEALLKVNFIKYEDDSYDPIEKTLPLEGQWVNLIVYDSIVGKRKRIKARYEILSDAELKDVSGSTIAWWSEVGDVIDDGIAESWTFLEVGEDE